MGQEDVFAPGDALRNAEILYMDGDSQGRDALRRLLLSCGTARVQVAESAKDAINVVLGTPCNLASPNIASRRRMESTWFTRFAKFQIIQAPLCPSSW